MALLRLKDVYSLSILCLLLITVNNVSAANQTMKKVLPPDSAMAEGNIFQETELSTVIVDKNSKQAVEMAEKTTAAKQNANEGAVNQATTKRTHAANQQKQSPYQSEQRTIKPLEHWVNTVEESQHNLKEVHLDYDDEDLPDSYITGFYIFLGLSIGAMLFIFIKVYRLRLSRAERKYGVQGDRSTQELVPLPVSIEDGVSEDEDQTLFEVNRQQIRIL
ncbi:PREDICTED: uncharacterized protein LOC108379283 [Rhagoletis zephyria]|uniref:uncharacterized protein LOC108379283 n=1 Tax=Rhagoletis zephyria TaxID=28612 RepID=UPI0008118D90|nr:PREDICTED: uncharacterized protein LOC108379283 [Rhagoletis zephyria]